MSVIVCLSDPLLAARMRHALRLEADVLERACLRDVRAAVVREPRVRAVVIEPRDRTGEFAESLVRDLAGSGVAVVISCRAGAASSPAIRDLALAGAREFLFQDIDDHGVAMRSVVTAAVHSVAADHVLERLLPYVPTPMHEFVRYAVRYPQAGRRVADVARALGVHRKTVFNQARSTGGPAPAELLAWARLSLAAAYLAWFSYRTVESISNELEFSTVNALRNMMKRYTGLRASEIREQGGCVQVVRAFAKATGQPYRDEPDQRSAGA